MGNWPQIIFMLSLSALILTCAAYILYDLILSVQHNQKYR